MVQDQSGLRGGLFDDRVEALKFAMFETGNRPQAVIMVPGIFELDLSGKPAAASDPAAGDQAPTGARPLRLTTVLKRSGNRSHASPGT